MVVPNFVTEWVEKTYKRPRIDPEWLNDCYDWLTTEGGHDPNTNSQTLFDAIEHQILESDFGDSMLPGTGLPTHIAVPTTTTVLKGSQILVEIVSITEIASSAFTLNQTRIAREERMKAGVVGEEDGEGDIDVEGEGPMPKYSRGMLKFQLFDGTTTLPAIEYRPLPELSLENTPLGYKILLTDVSIRRGIAFLEPKCVVLMGHKTDDREELRPTEFARGLRARMGLPEPEPEPVLATATATAENNTIGPIHGLQGQNQQELRSPLREISHPSLPSSAALINDDENLEPQRRRIPSYQPTLTPDPASSSTLVLSESGTSTQVTTTSPHFSTVSALESTKSNNPLDTTEIDIVLSPRRQHHRPTFINSPPSFLQDENFWSDEAPDKIKRSQEVKVGRALKEHKGKEKEKDVLSSSDEFDNSSMDLDPEFLVGLDIVEQEAYSRAEMPPLHSANVVAKSKSRISGPGGRSQASVPPIRHVMNRNAEIGINVITIDDEEEEDKENTPVATRHVRRRTEDSGGSDVEYMGTSSSQRAREAGRPAILARTASDVIELSDSD